MATERRRYEQRNVAGIHGRPPADSEFVGMGFDRRIVRLCVSHPDTPFLKRRRDWFERMEVGFVHWWIPLGRIPTVPEGLERLEDLRTYGPSPRVFTFRQQFDRPIETS